MPVACAPSVHLTRTASASLRSPFAVPSRTCPRDDPGSCAQQPLRYRFALAPMSCRCRCEGTQFPRGRRRRPGERSDRCDEGAPAHSTITSSRTNRHRPATVPHSRRPLTDTSARERSEREGGRPRPTGGAERDRCSEMDFVPSLIGSTSSRLLRDEGAPAHEQDNSATTPRIRVRERSSPEREAARGRPV
jgi:hypothetical protein